MARARRKQSESARLVLHDMALIVLSVLVAVLLVRTDVIGGLLHSTRELLKVPWLRGLLFLLGGLIIASPLPDELGISLFGFSKAKTSWFVPLSFTFNFIGIVLIGLVAQAV